MEIEPVVPVPPTNEEPKQEQSTNKKSKKQQEEINPELFSQELKNWKTQYTQLENDLLSQLNKGLPKHHTDFSPIFASTDINSLPPQEFEELIGMAIDQTCCQNILETIKIIKHTFNCPSMEDSEIQQIFFKVATRQNYIDKIKAIPTPLHLEEFYIWELRNPDLLSKHQVDMLEFANAKRKRAHQQRVMEKLDVLVSMIKRATSDDFLPKINKLFDEYQKVLQNEPQLLKPKVEKEKKINSDVQKSVKKLKIDSDKDQNTMDGEQNEENCEKVEKVSKKNKKKSLKIVDENGEEIEKKVKEPKEPKPLKEIKPPKETKEQIQMKNQHKLFNFFGKKAEKSPIPQQPEVAQNLQESQNILSQINNLSAHTPESFTLFLKNTERPFLKGVRNFFYFHDSLYQQKTKKISYFVTPTQPLQKDLGINYDIDSDEELELQDAEDCENISENDEETYEDTSDDGFIVPDGHLSEDENSQDQTKKQVQSGQHNFSCKQYVLNFRNYEEGKDKTMDEQYQHYKIINISQLGRLFNLDFPLKTIKDKKSQIEEVKEPETFEIKANQLQFVKLVHGSYTKRTVLVDEFNSSFPKCSKTKIMKMLHEWAKKCKLETDKKERFYVNQDILELVGVSPEQATQWVIYRREEYKQKQIEHKQLMKQMQENEKQLAQTMIHTEEQEVVQQPSENSYTINKQPLLDGFFNKK